MATSKAVRADDVSGLNIGTVSFTEDAVTKDFQRVVLNSGSTVGNMADVTAANALKVDGSGVTQPVSVAAVLSVKPTDGTNAITKTFDLDSSGSTHEWNLGVGLRKKASGGSVEAGTSTDPLRIDPTGTTIQPVSASSLPLPTGASTAAKQPALGTAGSASADVITIQGVASMTAVKVDGSGVTQPVSGTVTTTPPSNASTNVAQLAGTATSVNSGTKDAGTLRVVLATDQPALTNKLLVTPDSVALPANQSVNLNQAAGTALDVNSGNKSAGTIRVVLATDQPALTNKLLVTPDAVALPAGTALIGAISASAETATVYSGTTALTPKFVTIVASSSGVTNVLALVAAKKLRVLALQLVANAAVNVKWQSHVTPTDITGLAYLAANGGYVLPFNPVGWFQTISGEALDINLSGAVAVGGSLCYVEV